MEVILILILLLPLGQWVMNDVFLCSQAAETEPSFYFDFWHFRMSVCSRRHHARDLLP